MPIGLLQTFSPPPSDARPNWPRCVIAMRQGVGRPLWFIHGGDGGVHIYQPLIARLANPRPVYGIEQPFLTDLSQLNSAESLQALATSYVTMLRQTQPQGPYCLIGYSFGALIAYEMASQLIAMGEKIDRLILIDAQNPKAPVKTLSVPQRLLTRWRIEAGPPFLTRLKLVWRRLVSGKREAAIRATELKAVHDANAQGQRAPVELRSVEAVDQNMKLVDNWSPQPLPDNMDLIIGTTPNDKWVLAPQRGWDALCQGKLRVSEIPCAHLEFFDPPHIDALAAQIDTMTEG